MLFLAGKGPLDSCREEAKEVIKNGRAFEKFCEMTAAQGGDDSYLRYPDKFPKAGIIQPVTAHTQGFITAMDTQSVGMASVLLGAGRLTIDDSIDQAAGIVLEKKPGDKVAKGETLAWLHTSTNDRIKEAEKIFRQGIMIGSEKPRETRLILEYID